MYIFIDVYQLKINDRKTNKSYNLFCEAHKVYTPAGGVREGKTCSGFVKTIFAI